MNNVHMYAIQYCKCTYVSGNLILALSSEKLFMSNAKFTINIKLNSSNLSTVIAHC